MLCLRDSHAGGIPLLELQLAFFRRVARDPSILTLTSDEVMGLGRNLSRHKGCHGCPSCNGPGWQFKAESVATLWPMCCKAPTTLVQWTVLYRALSHALSLQLDSKPHLCETCTNNTPCVACNLNSTPTVLVAVPAFFTLPSQSSDSS